MACGRFLKTGFSKWGKRIREVLQAVTENFQFPRSYFSTHFPEKTSLKISALLLRVLAHF